jgi:hypothetical protein
MGKQNIENGTVALIALTELKVTVRSKAWVCGRSLDGTAGSNQAGSMHVCLL